MLFVRSTRAKRSGGSTALDSSPVPAKERTTDAFPSVMEVGSAVVTLCEISLWSGTYLGVGL